MTNEKKLELTLCGIFPYGLCVCDSLNQIVKVIGVKNQTYFIENGNNYAYADIRDCKPLLHSLDKLTEPILDGGLIPMDEFRKIAPFTYSNDELAKGMIDMFKEDLIMVPFWVIKKLKEWHFNIYDLPKEMYIEKSESNGK